jgi:hypothetical protein
VISAGIDHDFTTFCRCKISLGENKTTIDHGGARVRSVAVSDFISERA